MTRLTDERIDSLIERHVGGHEITDDEYESMVQFARAIESALRELIADAERPKLTWVGYQLQRLIGNPAVTMPFWTEWTDCTKEQYEHAIATPDHQGRVLYASHDDSLGRP